MKTEKALKVAIDLIKEEIEAYEQQMDKDMQKEYEDAIVVLERLKEHNRSLNAVKRTCMKPIADCHEDKCTNCVDTSCTLNKKEIKP